MRVVQMMGLVVAVAGQALGPTVEIAKGVIMPTLNLGTCCGSDPSVGLTPWFQAGGRGVDTAWDYKDQPVIGAILKQPSSPPRAEIFILTKIPAGFGNSSDCNADPSIAMRYVQDDIAQLGVKQVDLVLLHAPCPNNPAGNNALWKGLEQALAAGLTRSIGVSNYNAAQLAALKTTTTKPALNQCRLGVDYHDDATISYCQKNGIYYESYDALKGCPSNDNRVKTIAAAHSKTTYQICLRWVLERGCVVTAGTGNDPTTVGQFAKENLDIYDWSLTADEIAILNKIA
jgi:diketogulonate reductase-like aldo/keto reductase